MATTKTTKGKSFKSCNKENVSSVLDAADITSAIDLNQLKKHQEELRQQEMVKRRRVAIQSDTPKMSKGASTINTAELKKLKDQASQLEPTKKKLGKLEKQVQNRDDRILKLEAEKEGAEKECQTVKDELAEVKTELADTKTKHEELKTENGKTLKEVESLKKKVTALEQKLKALQGKSANPKDEYKKFARVLSDKSSPDLVTWGTKIYGRMMSQFENPEELTSKISVEDYVRVYSHIILQELSDCRQYVQTQLMNAAESFYEKFDRAPSHEDMMEIRKLATEVDEKHKEDTEHEFTEDELEALWKLTWYHDCWLNKASVYAKYGNTARYYEPANAKNQDGRYHITIQTEAFAEMVRNNCEAKWNAVFKLRKNDDKRSKTPIPKFNKDKKETHIYHATKWTDPKSGPKKGGGWKGGWATVWRTTVIDFKDFRTEQKKQNNLFYVLGLKLVRTVNDVSHTSYENSRKRKRTTVDDPEPEDEPVDDCGDDFAESDVED